MPVSIKEVAKSTGFSVQTVSRVLNNRHEGYRKATCDHIARVAEEMGYRPNSLARAMVLGKFGAVGLLLSTNSGRSYLPQLLLTGIHDALAQENLHLTVGRLPDEKLTDSDYVPKMFREWSCDGVLINYNDHIPEKMEELIQKSKIPSVWINTKRASDCVHPDDFGGGKLAVEYLHSLGHTRIAYMHMRWGQDLKDAHYSVVDRLGGYLAGMREAGLKSMVVEKGYMIPGPERVAVFQEWLRMENPPTAVITYTNPEVVTLAALQMGIPLDKAPLVLSFSELPMMFGGLPAHTLFLKQNEMGHTAVRMLMEKMKNPEVPLPPQAIPYCIYRGYDQVRP